MKTEETKALLRRYFKTVWDEQNPAAVDDFLAPGYKRHRSPTAAPLTREGQKELLTQFRAAFPDARITLEDVIAEGDRIAFRSTLRATHQGEFLGIAATGKGVEVSLLDVICIEDGKFVEQWGGPDLFSLLQQLGAAFSVKQQGS
jgi:predicted ester cyclase